MISVEKSESFAADGNASADAAGAASGDHAEGVAAEHGGSSFY